MRCHKGLCANARLGQQKNGGWSEKGLEERVKTRDMLVKDRKKNGQKYADQDQIFLDWIRDEKDITEETPELEANKNRRGKSKNKNTKGVNSKVIKALGATYNDSDSDDEEEESEHASAQGDPESEDSDDGLVG